MLQVGPASHWMRHKLLCIGGAGTPTRRTQCETSPKLVWMCCAFSSLRADAPALTMSPTLQTLTHALDMYLHLRLRRNIAHDASSVIQPPPRSLKFM